MKTQASRLERQELTRGRRRAICSLQDQSLDAGVPEKRLVACDPASKSKRQAEVGGARGLDRGLDSLFLRV